MFFKIYKQIQVAQLIDVVSCLCGEMLSGVNFLILAAVLAALVSVGVYYGAEPVRMASNVKMSNVDSSSFSNPGK